MSPLSIITHSQALYTEHKGLAWFSSPLAEASHHIHHAFFTRTGGVSTGEYTSLNCRWASDDDPLHIHHNFERIGSTFDGPTPPPLLIARQIHGAEVLVVDAPWSMDHRPTADGLVTRHPHCVIGITTADCVPLLLVDPVMSVIGAIHVGWRGAAQEIVFVALQKMVQEGAKLSNIQALIGPAIQQTSYPVGREVYDAFSGVIQEHSFEFIAHDQWLFDLPGTVVFQLQEHPIKDIEHFALDTRSMPHLFFSCRRASDEARPNMFGTQFSGIMISSTQNSQNSAPC